MTTLVANRFELGRVAGKGGMATVHEARDQATGAIVAVKIVDGAFANARFEREASVLARLSHPGIVRYIAHGRIDHDRMYLAMEWLEGTTLESHLQKGAISIEETITIGMRIASALAAAHAAGVIHRDVKPSNIVLRGAQAEQAVLVDFGIARAEQASRVMTATGAVVGTPAYMAPEQVRGESSVDARADLFSLGCVLFECLSGQPPFVGEHVVAVLAKILLERAPRVGALRRDVPPALDALIGSLLEKSPEARPATVATVVSTLERMSVSGTSTESVVAAEKTLTLGRAEQRLATVLLAQPRRTAAIGDVDDLVSADTHLAGVTVEGLMTEVASRFGVEAHRMADGSLLATVTGEAGPAAALRIVRAALAFEKELDGVAIAIATGRAITASVVPFGEAIDVAARTVRARVNEGGVWICCTTDAMTEGRFEVSRSGAAVRVHRLARALRKTTPFVGRDRELNMLTATFEECADEPVARACVVVAPPGVGKSRLQRELVESIVSRRTEAAVWTGMADPVTQSAPYAFIGDLLRRVFGIVEDEPLAIGQNKIKERLGSLELSRADVYRLARRLGELSGTPFGDDGDEAFRAAKRDPLLFAAQATEAFVDLVVASLARHPHLLVLEDIHWADAASIRLITAALARAKDLPLMVVALARPSIDDAYPKLWEEQRCQRIVLEPLLKKAAERLARAVLGEAADVRAIVERAGGNALFVEELARASAEGKLASDLPATIAAVTESRLAALSADARRVLRAASIFGERFWSGGVAALVGPADAARVETNLELLEQHEVIRSVASARFGEGEREYAFHHAITRDVAYEMLTPADRVLGHALAGTWLEARVDDGPLLAHHFEAGEKPADAARWYARAVEQALAAHDFSSLDRFVARATLCGASGAALGSAKLAQADAKLFLRDHAGAAQASGEAVALLQPSSEKWFNAVGLAITSRGRLNDVKGVHELMPLLEQAPLDDGAARAKSITRARAAIQLAYFGEIARADALLERWEQDPSVNDPAVLAWFYEAVAERGNAAGEPADPKILRRGRELRLGIGDRRGAITQWQVELQLISSLGAYERAFALCDELVEVPDHWIPHKELLDFAKANIETIRGDVEPLLRALAALDLSAWPRAAVGAFALAAQSLVPLGRLAEARRFADQSLAYPDGSHGFQAVAVAALSRVETKEGNVARGRELAEKAFLYAKEGVPINGVHSLHLARFEVLVAEGRTDDARAALRAGIEDLHARTRHVPDYRAALFAGWENPRLFELAREHGIAVA